MSIIKNTLKIIAMAFIIIIAIYLLSFIIDLEGFLAGPLVLLVMIPLVIFDNLGLPVVAPDTGGGGFIEFPTPNLLGYILIAIFDVVVLFALWKMFKKFTKSINSQKYVT